MGSKDCKIGITSNPIVRLGVYQNSYSRKSHIARFDLVYIGSNRIISNLEKAVKNEFSWDIELDGRGHSEWISKPYEMLESQIDKIINGYNFKVKKVPKNNGFSDFFKTAGITPMVLMMGPVKGLVIIVLLYK